MNGDLFYTPRTVLAEDVAREPVDPKTGAELARLLFDRRPPGDLAHPRDR